ncbi:MAG: gliding motility-associated C-terminal domain-containing protein [Saprospiraceae bacterium]
MWFIIFLNHAEVKSKPRITALSSDVPQCLDGNDCVTLYPTIYPFNNSEYDYFWSGPDGFESDVLNPVICNFNESNNGIYSLVVSDGSCYSDTTTISIDANLMPPTPVISSTDKYCEGENIVLKIENEYGSGTKYYWTKAPGGIEFTTSVPLLVISDASTSNSGTYSVYAERDGCASAISDSIDITVITNPNKPYITGEDKICEGDAIELYTSYVANGEYHWTGPNGFSSEYQNPKILPSSLSYTGVYNLTVSVDGCMSEPAESFMVEVVKVPEIPVVLNADTSYCVQNNISVLDLCLQDIEANTTYKWYLNTIPAKLLGESMNKCVSISDFTNLKDGENSIYVIAERDGCSSYYSDIANVDISKTPSRKADAGQDQIVCEPDNVLLDATIDPEGQWSTLNNNSFIENPDKAITFVYDLEEGSNLFVWSLSHGACLNFDSDTVDVFLVSYPEAVNDFYATSYNTQIIINPIINDINAENCTINIVYDTDIHGDLIDNGNGTFTYTPNTGYIGQITLNYKIINSNCPENYDSGVITIEIGNDEDCFGVNVITPNGDGINDNLIFPCLESGIYPKNELIVFNEWGNQVFSKYNYNNDWQGTYNGKDLPVGTYYYVLFLDSDRKFSLNGFFVIER